MNEPIYFDAIIIGGGLAGLSLSIQLAKAKFAVALFEKEQYPFHKVCGEYISMESWNFIVSLGMPLAEMQLPIIKKLLVTAPGGNLLQQSLPLGGFGISRYTLDNKLKNIAAQHGVMVMENCRVDEVIFGNDQFTITAGANQYCCKVCCGSFGKRSNLDVKWGRNFINKKSNKLNNYIGVKYHIKTEFAIDQIALHNFKDGYCGISAIEDGKYCLCYLTNAANLKANNNSIAVMEKNVLHQNKYLKKIFENSEFLYQSPVTISQISFNEKSQIENHLLMLGDAAGLITPLCGNGMSMALHSSKIVSGYIIEFLNNNISRSTMEESYLIHWKKTFHKRLRYGRWIQSLFGKEWITNIFVSVMKRLPWVTKQLIKQTHGKPF
jgi:flavin-dependent dehydrogenase